ncbi:MAG: hypothetical protein OMM_07645 [Candidatus Magnetoglobus multicellularis str. Araruama]|uniref:Globin-sensor domain-containing protein n=1 Tax=Candidatus Magnetoglobus multicellularis str. Araruama TaxID=890399 RepID=A0A1V1PBL8_9BACT|nr:MAG: hypothetical protein OMM_07645 [Candidatus Magnetoglobus multicellularis str. Araruama]
MSAIPASHVKELADKMDVLLADMNDIMCKRSDINCLVGSDNIQMMKDNHANHLRFVHSLLEQYDRNVLVDTVSWVYRSYRSRGFHMNYWAAQINTWITVLKKHLSESAFESIYPLYKWFSISVPHFSHMSDDDLSNVQPDLCLHNEKDTDD